MLLKWLILIGIGAIVFATGSESRDGNTSAVVYNMMTALILTLIYLLG